MDEFDVIRRFFSPLAQGAPGSFQLTDDVAVLEEAAYVFSKDVLVEGVHFLPRDPLDLVARKALRANLSDLAAKGAKPCGYFLGCVWRRDVDVDDIEQFSRGLFEDQTTFKLALFGGDTTVHKTKSAPFTLSLTVFGTPPRRGVIRRNGAGVGDDLYVSGTIGDAGLGLAALTKEIEFTRVDRASLAGRYHLPEPRLTLGAALAGIATASADVSDGLVADANQIAMASGVGARIFLNDVPLSETTRRWVDGEPSRDEALLRLATAGDDYEILFTAPTTLRRSVEMAAKASRSTVTRIGEMTKSPGVVTVDGRGEQVEAVASGYNHFQKR